MAEVYFNRRKIRRNVQLLDHAGNKQDVISAEHALFLLTKGAIGGGTEKIIKSVMFAIDHADTTSGARSRGTTPLGTPRREGRAFSFDYIPEHRRVDFEQVIREAGAVDRVLPMVAKFAHYIEVSTVPCIPLVPVKRTAVVIPFPVRKQVQEFRKAA